MPRMTLEEQAEFDRKYPLNATIIFGVKPPRWWQEKYGKVSQQEPEAAKPKQSKTNR